jgi:DNA helicase-2/ATP-dependent DNA helicase PcrA
MGLFPKENFSLNEAQEAAVRAPAGPLLIVAGAGTGKTRTLTSRMAHFMEQGMKPERICAITFTNKAAKEMADRVARFLPSQRGGDSHSDANRRGYLSARKPLIGTFHSLGARILRKECRAFGRDFNFTIFDDHDSFDVIKKVLKSSAENMEDNPSQSPLGEVRSKKETPAFFIEQISKSKNLDTFSGEEAAPRNGVGAEKISSVLSRYEGALKENNAFDFDDLIEKVVGLFKSNPRILEKYQNMFDAILVDEYQDINPKQHEFIKLLAGGHRNLSAVGDDEQTIYGWRYADIKIFLNFEREWPGAQVHFLEENYRSTGAIIRGAAGVVKNNRVRAPKNLYTKNPDGVPISLFEAWTETDEAERVTEEIGKIIKTSSPPFKGELEGVRARTQLFLRANVLSQTPPNLPLKGEEPDRSIAVLYRTNAQSRAIEQALIRRDLPYRIFGGLKFYERREVKDAVAGLRYAANPHDTVARDRLEKNLTKRKFAVFRARLGEIKDKKPIDILNAFLEIYQYMNYLADNFTNPEERQENIAELAAFVGSFDNMSELLERLGLLQSTDDEQSNSKFGAHKGESVNLMTIHMAKGLEFDNVFLIGISEGLMPHVRSMDKELQIEEERRLMYVAMTRARQKLFISFYGMPSRFISEIPEDCITLATSADSDSHTKEDDEEIIYF